LIKALACSVREGLRFSTGKSKIVWLYDNFYHTTEFEFCQ
jgi:hypothetical protein